MPIKPHTSTPPATRPLVGAALLALALAGCGGSSSGDSGGAGASDAGAITPKTNGSHASSGGDAARRQPECRPERGTLHRQVTAMPMRRPNPPAVQRP